MPAPKTRVCTLCPPGTPPWPLDIRYFTRRSKGPGQFETQCKACRRRTARESRVRYNGRPCDLAQALTRDIPTPSVWIIPRFGREVSFRVDSINVMSGVRASGTIGQKRITVMVEWLRKHGRRVTDEAAE